MSECSEALKEVTVVVPVLNEEEAIGPVLDELLATGIPKDNILVVDGGSTDRTVEVAKSRGVKVIRQEGRGKAMAVATALRYVRTPYVLLMDGDYTYPAKHVCDLVRELLRGNDFVLGVRSWGRGSQGIIYRLGNRILTKLFNTLFGTSIRDVLTGMYAARTEALKEVGFEMNHFSLESEVVAHMIATGKKVAQVPIEYRKRLGKKKLGIAHGIGIARDMIRLTWRYNPASLIFMLGALLLIPGIALSIYVGYHYLFTGIKHHVKGLIAVLLTTTGFTSLLLSVMAIYIKRAEMRTQRKIDELKKLIEELIKERERQ